MDAGKFLHLINAGALSQHALFSERIARMGEAAGAEWKLTSLDANAVVFEDVGEHTYYLADILRQGKGRVSIENIRELKIVESKKENSFHKNVIELVDAITESDNSRADAVFNRITAQRFRSSVIPESGFVTTRDGITRHVKVSKSIVDEAVKPRIVSALCEALSENVKISRGRIVEGVFGDVTLKFPITELTRRRVIARHMKSVAQHAYMAEGFQERVKHVASLLSEDDGKNGNLDKAVMVAAELLKEYEEFSLLTKIETQTLIGDTLATYGCMNQALAEDVGELFYTTNCKVNRETIINDWSIAARVAESAPLVENVRILRESENFDSDYEAFLRTTFTEDMTTKVAKAKMYLSALQGMKNVLAGSKADQELVGSLDSYIVRLETAGDDVDDATLMEIEEMVASTSEGLLGDLETLSEYSNIPEIDGGAKSPSFGDEMLAGKPGGGMGAPGGGLGGGASLPLGGDDLGGEEPGAGPEAGLAGAPGGAAPGLGGAPKPAGAPPGAPGAPPPLGGMKKKPMGPPMGGPLMQDANRKGKTLAENTGMCAECNSPMAECKCEKDEETSECSESIEGILSRLDNDGKRDFLQQELTEWKKNAAKFFNEDGIAACKEHLLLCSKYAAKMEDRGLAQSFKNIVIEHTPVTEEVNSYQYKAPTNAKINSNYGGVKEDHEQTNLQKKMKEVDGKSASEGGKAPPKGDAMGEAGEPNMNVSPDGHKDAQLKKASQAKVESKDPNRLICPECKGNFDLTECMGAKGAACPECNCDVSQELMEALSISENLKDCGHQMDRIEGGKGVTKDGMAKADGRDGAGASGGSKNHRMERIGGGKSIAGDSAKEVEGTSGEGKGKKETMEHPLGKGKGVAETQRHPPTKRSPRGFARASINPKKESTTKDGKPVSEETTVSISGSEETPGRTDNRSVTLTTDEPVDDVVAKIADTISLAGEEGMDGLGGEGMPGEEGLPGEGEGMPGEEGLPGEGGEGLPGEGGEEMPGEGEEAGAASPTSMAGTMDDEGGMPPEEGGELPVDEPGAEGGEEGSEAPPEFGGEEGGEEAPPEEPGTPPIAPPKGKGKPFGEDKDWLKKKIAEREGKKDGDEGGEASSKCEKCDKEPCECDEEPVKEDNDITAPTNKTYTSAEAARKDGGETSAGKAAGGKEMNPKPKFSEKDYNGTKGAKTARPYGSKE